MLHGGGVPPFVVATGNPDKFVEILGIMDGIRLLMRPEGIEEPPEDGATLAENARIKAVSVVDALGTPAIADDTGLEVDALGGAPGVFSSRFAGVGANYADNVAKLLAELQGAEDRRARFRTVALARFADGSELVAEGVVEGRIAVAPRGESGFGYDPVFVPEAGDGRTFAEMRGEEKHAISHRGSAFRRLARLIAERGLGG